MTKISIILETIRMLWRMTKMFIRTSGVCMINLMTRMGLLCRRNKILICQSRVCQVLAPMSSRIFSAIPATLRGYCHRCDLYVEHPLTLPRPFSLSSPLGRCSPLPSHHLTLRQNKAHCNSVLTCPLLEHQHLFHHR